MKATPKDQQYDRIKDHFRKPKKNVEELYKPSWFAFILNIIFVIGLISLKMLKLDSWFDLLLCVILTEFIIFVIPKTIYLKSKFAIVSIIFFILFFTALYFQMPLALTFLLIPMILTIQKIRMSKNKL